MLSPANATEKSKKDPTIQLAITIDDLPWVGPLPDGDSAIQAVSRIAAVLRVYQAPAIAFVVSDRAIEDEQALQSWVNWGFAIGNHSAAHRDLNRTPVDEWLAEVALTRAHAYALTTENAPLRQAIGRDFVRHIIAAVAHADSVARRKVGRSVPQILLLHANTLVADKLDALLLELRAGGVEFITLEKALAGDAEDTQPNRVSIRHISPRAPKQLAAIFAEAGRSERMRSLLIMHKGALIAEAYFNGAGPETPANLKSVTKSLVSALVGVALRKGWIESVGDPIGRYLPERFDTQSAKAAITIRQLLTMSTGLQPVSYGSIQQSTDWVGTLLAQPITREAKDSFVYDTPVLHCSPPCCAIPVACPLANWRSASFSRLSVASCFTGASMHKTRS